MNLSSPRQKGQNKWSHRDKNQSENMKNTITIKWKKSSNRFLVAQRVERDLHSSCPFVRVSTSKTFNPKLLPMFRSTPCVVDHCTSVYDCVKVWMRGKNGKCSIDEHTDNSAARSRHLLGYISIECPYSDGTVGRKAWKQWNYYSKARKTQTIIYISR